MPGRFPRLEMHVSDSVAQVPVSCFWAANGPDKGRVFGRMAGRLLWLVLHVVGRVARVPVFCFWAANGPVMGRDFVRMAGRLRRVVTHVGASVAEVPVFCFWGANGPVMGCVFARRRGRGLGLSESGFGTDDGCLNYELQWPVVRTMTYLISLMDTVFCAG